MNSINPKKLLNSKWTSTKPKNKEKHFIVIKVKFDEEGVVTLCLIEAVMTKKSTAINWCDFKDNKNWIHGWK